MGSLHVVCGPMFSGKTEYLIDTLKCFEKEGRKVEAFKPIIDKRYSVDKIASHNGKQFGARVISQEKPFDFAAQPAEVIAVDEVQFFDPWIVGALDQAVRHGHSVVVSGLDLTYKAEPFGPMPQLLCIADVVLKLRAICAKCRQPASRTYRTSADTSGVLVGGAEAYEPRCVGCFLR